MAKIPVKPITVKVMVRTPGGKGIEQALVKMMSSGLSEPAVARTDKAGVATFPLPDSMFPEGTSEVEVQLVSSKAHHGPVAEKGKDFANGPTKATVKVAKKGAFAEGTAGLDKNGRLEMVLVDGGMLGKLHESTLTRRLSTQEIIEELLHRHARGDIRMVGAGEFKCKHEVSATDPDGENGEACTDACSVDAPAQTATSRISVDGAMFGVSTYALQQFHDAYKSVQVVTYAKKKTLVLLYRRHALGLARLYKMLAAEGCVAMYTVGLDGSDPTKRNDCHGQGRAMDISGVAKEEPNGTKTKRSGSYLELPIRLEKDFVVYFHWGMVKLKVKTTDSAGTETTTYENEKAKNYSTEEATSTNGWLVYRLDPNPPTTALPKGVTMTDSHMVEAGRLFKLIYDFVAKEYSFGDKYLGPLDSLALKAETQANLEAADAGDPPEIGSHAHYMLYPDYPKPTSPKKPGSDKIPKDGRQDHVNHFHVQLGETGTQDWKTLT